ncbi:transposable element Tcb1 transposase [Trichonephila clavipes]|nr:transposable element Tcb1 transposase [Trichonephila clavipes]
MKEGCGWQNRMKFSLLTSHASVTPRWSDSSLETPWREDAEQLRYAPARWSYTGAWSQPYFNRIMGDHTWVQRLFVNHQIELLPFPARSLHLSPIENMWSMVAQRLTQITPPAATPDQLWHCVEAAWSAVPKNTSKISLIQCRGV